MKLYLALFLFVFLPVALFSRDITTLSGITYNNATVFDSNAGGLTISYQDKNNPELTIMKPIPFSDLPEPIRKEFNYDPVKAKSFEKAQKELENNKTENAISTWVPDTQESTAAANYNPVPLEGGIAPGEKNGAAEANAMKQEALQNGLAPGEREGAAESNAIRREAAENGIAPGEKDGAAEGRAIRREAMENNLAPGEKEGAAEGRAIKKEAFGNPNIPGEKEAFEF
jgi:hypothetical protein